MRFRKRPGTGPSRATITAVAAVAAATLMAACGSSGNSSSTSSGATAASSAGMTPIGVDLTYNNTAFWAAYINYENQ